ncbi:hypothetical protein G7054_g5477 [Neopestalotiopsis clavispora]|nr:hypothetical protein G7054_g5477 [Neopestalotiopsis clavispora]
MIRSRLLQNAAVLVAAAAAVVSASGNTTWSGSAASPPLFLNNNTQKFAVDGASLPEFSFDIGESYAGLLPITSDPNDPNKLWFWFVPSTNPEATKEIIVFFNGGPGCSSQIGMFYENGPFLWQDGTLEPVSNPWAWSKLTNVMWIDQPVNTGYSTGTPTVENQSDVADQFLGFWKNFIDTFSLQGADVYLSGQSYAGRYLSYIGTAMLDANDTTYYNLQGSMFIDTLIADHQIQQDFDVVQFVDNQNEFLRLNDTFLDQIRYASDACGIDEYRSTHLVYPGNANASTDLPSVETYEYDGVERACEDITADVLVALTSINPCFDETHISNYCPKLASALGYPSYAVPTLEDDEYEQDDVISKRAYDFKQPYLNREDVKLALHAPLAKFWVLCNQKGVSVNGTTIGATQPVKGRLGDLIERSQRTVIVHGALDMQVTVNGTLMALQSMEWGGATGFSTPPSEDFFVPTHSNRAIAATAPKGNSGKVITERGLTFVEVFGAGHQVPRYNPSGSYRQLEYLLGRVDSLTENIPFTTDTA